MTKASDARIKRRQASKRGRKNLIVQKKSAQLEVVAPGRNEVTVPKFPPDTPDAEVRASVEQHLRDIFEQYASNEEVHRRAAQRRGLLLLIRFGRQYIPDDALFHTMVDLAIDLEDHDNGVAVPRFAPPKRKQGRPALENESSRPWIARACIVASGQSLQKRDGLTDPKPAYLQAIKDIKRKLGTAAEQALGAVIGSRVVTGKEREDRGWSARTTRNDSQAVTVMDHAKWLASEASQGNLGRELLDVTLREKINGGSYDELVGIAVFRIRRLSQATA